MNKLKKEKRKLFILIISFIIIFLLFWISPTFTSCIECDWDSCKDCTNYHIAEKIILISFIISTIIITILGIISLKKIVKIKNKGDDKNEI